MPLFKQGSFGATPFFVKGRAVPIIRKPPIPTESCYNLSVRRHVPFNLEEGDMVPQQQEEQVDRKKRRKRFPWIHLVATSIALLLIILGLILSIRGISQGSTVFTVLGILIGLFQWL